MIDTIRWGDSVQLPATAGAPIRTRELFRVEAPFPTTWRVMGVVVFANPANLAVKIRFNLSVGVGSTTIGPFPVSVSPNTFFTFELPGQGVNGLFETDGAAVNDDWAFAALIAPNVPWHGLNVKLES